MENNPVFILLAGGKSSRMGVAKGLLKYNKTFWILEQIQRISETGILRIYIGLGYDFQHYFDAIDWFEKACETPQKFLDLTITIIINKNPELGSFSTLQKVLFEIPIGLELIINPIDTPILSKSAFKQFLKTYNSVVIVNHLTKNGHPIKLEYVFWKHLKSLKLGDSESRLDIQIKKLAASKITSLEVSDAAVLLNLNTPTEWKEYLNSYC